MSGTSKLLWDEYFLKLVDTVSLKSHCIRRKVGAIIVIDKRIIATGYNGVPKGFPHCDEIGCIREKLGIPEGERHELCLGLHAEQNAIIQAAVFGVSIKGATLYVTHFPCSVCAKMIVNAEIKEVVFLNDYPDELSKEILKKSNIKVRQFQP